MTVELKPHQTTVLGKLGNGKILCGGTGVGKSITAMAYYVGVECGGDYNTFGTMTDPKDVYVITTALKRDKLDWDKEAIAFGVSTVREASRDGVKLTVDSWNNIDKYLEVENAFFIFDEQRVVGSGAWAQSFIKIAKRNRWILLSATPGDTWLDYIPVFVANGFYKNRTAFKREHVVYNTFAKFPKVDHYIGVGKLVKYRNQLLVDMPYERHTVRHEEYVRVAHDEELMDKAVTKRWHVYEERPIRDVAELFIVMRRIANSDASRLEAVRSTLAKHPRLIVFYNFDYELEILRTLSDVPAWEDEVDVAEWNGHKHEELPTSDKWVYLVQYTAGSEGWNCITTDSTLFYSLTYSYKAFHQSKGRTDRLNTPFVDLWYKILVSTSAIDKAILRSLKQKRS